MPIITKNTGLKPSIRPSFVMDFTNGKTVDPRLNFARASRSTVYDENGTVKLLALNEPSIDFDPSTKECKGLLLEQGVTNRITHSPYMYAFGNIEYGFIDHCTNETLAPDGTFTASKLVQDYTSNVHRIYLYAGTLGSGVVTFSVYLKAGNGISSVTLRESNVTGTASTLAITSGQSVGNGWYRHQLQYVDNGSSSHAPSIYIQGSESAVQGSMDNYFYVWGPQLEVARHMTSFIYNPTTFASRGSRATYFDSNGVLKIAEKNQRRVTHAYDSVQQKWISQGFLQEPEKRNIIVRSNQNVGGVYNSTNLRMSAVSPDGYTNANKFIPNNGAAAGDSAVIISADAKPTSSGYYCWSVFVKAAGHSTLKLYDNNAGVSFNYNLSTLAITAGSSSAHRAGIINVGNGWYRVWMAGEVSSSVTYFQIYGLTTGNGSDGILWYGAQLEQGSYPSSYIPTVGTTVTRSGDSVNVVQNTRAHPFAIVVERDLAPYQHETDNTIYFENQKAYTVTNFSTPYPFYFYYNTPASGGRFDGLGNYGGYLEVYVHNLDYRGVYISNTTITKNALASGVGTNQGIWYANGVVPNAGGDSLVFNNQRHKIIRFQMSRATTGSYNEINGWFRKVAIYPKRLSNNELAELTK